MERSDVEGINRSGAKACERGASFFDNPHMSDQADWLASATVWAAGWRAADKGQDQTLAALDRVKFW